MRVVICVAEAAFQGKMCQRDFPVAATASLLSKYLGLRDFGDQSIAVSQKILLSSWTIVNIACRLAVGISGGDIAFFSVVIGNSKLTYTRWVIVLEKSIGYLLKLRTNTCVN